MAKADGTTGEWTGLSKRRWWLNAAGEVESAPATAEELAAARARVMAIRRQTADPIGLRSCWQCNSAHWYFLSKEGWGEWVCCCLWCGRFYVDGVDVTDYEGRDPGLEPGPDPEPIPDVVP